jgi:hypothetical protein
MRSADPGKLLPTTHVQNAVATDSAFERHSSGRFLSDYTDAGGLLGNRQPEQDIESRIGVFQWHNGESTLIGHIERVKAEDFAGSVHDLPDRNRPLLDTHARAGGGNLIQR